MASFDNKLKCFTAADSKLVGITRLLRRVFWPAYSFKRAPESSGAACKRGGGMALGRLVDRQVSNLDKAPTHPYARRAFEALRAAGLAPVASQVAVRFERLGTAADLVARDAKGSLCVVELKCSVDR